MKHIVRNILSIGALLIFLFQFLPRLASVSANGTPDAGQSIMQASTDTVTANGQSTFAITITIKDSSGNLITGDTVSLSSSDSTAIINPTSVTLNGSGQANFTMASNNPGTDTVNVTDGGTTITLQGSITFAPTPTPTLTPTPVGGCYDAAPGSTPQLTSAVSSDAHSVTLTWSAASTPVSYYLVSYGTTSGSYIYGNPNVGNVISYTVGSLATGKTYYFAVKAVNGCMAGSYSNELSGAAGVSASSSDSTSSPTPTSINGSSVNDQGTTQDLNSQPPTDTPSPTQGPPITPIVQASSTSPMTFVFAIIGAAVVLLVIAVGIFIRMSKKHNQEDVVNLTSNDQKPPVQLSDTHPIDKPIEPPNSDGY